MANNRGKTSLIRRRRNENPMREFDHLRPELRQWLSMAILPWRPRSVQRAFDRAFEKTRGTARAFDELDRMQQQRIAKDARRIWGNNHPFCGV